MDLPKIVKIKTLKKIERPCTYCKHFPGKNGDCSCPWYEPMDNLKYLEYKYEKKQHLQK
jgi:hypothetical protein